MSTSDGVLVPTLQPTPRARERVKRRHSRSAAHSRVFVLLRRCSYDTTSDFRSQSNNLRRARARTVTRGAPLTHDTAARLTAARSSRGNRYTASTAPAPPFVNVCTSVTFAMKSVMLVATDTDARGTGSAAPGPHATKSPHWGSCSGAAGGGRDAGAATGAGGAAPFAVLHIPHSRSPDAFSNVHTAQAQLADIAMRIAGDRASGHVTR